MSSTLYDKIIRLKKLFPAYNKDSQVDIKTPCEGSPLEAGSILEANE